MAPPLHSGGPVGSADVDFRGPRGPTTDPRGRPSHNHRNDPHGTTVGPHGPPFDLRDHHDGNRVNHHGPSHHSGERAGLLRGPRPDLRGPPPQNFPLDPRMREQSDFSHALANKDSRDGRPPSLHDFNNPPPGFTPLGFPPTGAPSGLLGSLDVDHRRPPSQPQHVNHPGMLHPLSSVTSVNEEMPSQC